MSSFTDCKISHLQDMALSHLPRDLPNNRSREKRTLFQSNTQESSYQYIYNRDGKNYSIASGMLDSLFKTHGYCVDPGSKTGLALSPESIEELKIIVSKNNDMNLLNTIISVSKGKAPSPRMVNDTIMYETTLNEKNRFDHFNCDNRTQTLSILRIILNIGLYLAGWKGGEEPYIITPRPVYDVVRVELKVLPMIQSLYINSHYPLVKNFPIMGYYRGSMLKPSVIDISLNIDQCLNRISLGMNQDYNQGYSLVASYLISTCYYYITTVCNTPLPMLEPLIRSLSI